MPKWEEDHYELEDFEEEALELETMDVSQDERVRQIEVSDFPER